MKILCFGLLILVGVVVAKNRFPSYIELCPSSVREAGPCIEKNVEIMRPYMEHGIPEMLVPALNPMVIPKAELTTGSMKAYFTNIKLYDLHTFKIKQLALNLDDLVFKIGLEFAKIRSDVRYQFKGKLLILELDSSGQANGTYENLVANVVTKGKAFERKGKNYMKLGDTKIELSIGDGQMFFNNLFKGNPLVTDHANQLINENFHDVIQEFIPILKQTVENIVVGIANNIFNKFSLEELFPQ